MTETPVIASGCSACAASDTGAVISSTRESVRGTSNRLSARSVRCHLFLPGDQEVAEAPRYHGLLRDHVVSLADVVAKVEQEWPAHVGDQLPVPRSEEHTSELQS